MKSKEVEIKGHRFLLHPLKAAYWKEKNALLIADLHLGKVTHFRKAGIAVPEMKKHEDLDKLHVVMHDFKPDQVFFLGDLFHSDQNEELQLLEDFIDHYDHTSFRLITGNHDLPGFLRRIEKKVSVYDKEVIEPFCLLHQPETTNEYYQICGHIHPAVKMRSKSKQYLKLPCFHITRERMILPAFGSFTGSGVILPRKQDRVFVVAGEEVVEVSGGQ
jgi:DNA ligase-associated metallophosphoesterase